MRIIIVLLVGILGAGSTTYYFMQRRMAPPPAAVTNTDAGPKVVYVEVLAAAKPISQGTFIRAEEALRWQPVEKDKVPEDALTKESVVPKDFDGAVATRSLKPGDIVSRTMLLTAADGGFLSAVLGRGMRAVSIAVNAVTGNAGFIFPGDRVDLILTHRVSAQDSGDSTYLSETFVQNTRVLAVDQTIKNEENKALVAKTVTVEVSPRQAELVNVASEMGRISLSLRSLDPAAASAMAEGGDANPYHRDITRSLGGEPRKIQVLSGGEAREVLLEGITGGDV